MANGLILAAPASMSGKTAVTLALIAALQRMGVQVAAAKSGPDYIDTAFLAAASGRPCRNLDPWAMRRETIAAAIASFAGADLVLCEGAMGLFDGIGREGSGSTASLAALVGWPIVLIVDCAGAGASVSALVEGFARHRLETKIAGLILNRVGSARHRALLEGALARDVPDLPLLGALPRDPALVLPSRHLGLVQAAEYRALDALIAHAAEKAAAAIDLTRLLALASPSSLATKHATAPIPPLGQNIAVARDQAFSFAYDHVLDGWRAAGASVSFFSPLADEPPDPSCDAIYLPGGYPELHGRALATARRFVDGVRDAAARGARIYGECGGYMVLGRGLVDADGARHEMAGLLPLETSFRERRLQLGYRQATLARGSALGNAGTAYRGHEFHYATICDEGPGDPLFALADGEGNALPSAGRIAGLVMGSFVHLVDRAP
jgi:cobyrinic acid a,c-diamide synthase